MTDEPHLRCRVCGEPVAKAHGVFVHADDTVTFRNGRLVATSDYGHRAEVDVIDVEATEVL